MSIKALKEVEDLHRKFSGAYLHNPGNVELVIEAVLDLADCMYRLRNEGNIGAYIRGLDLLDAFRREAALETLMEDPRDPSIMFAIAENLPVSTLSGLYFFIGSPDEVVKVAVSLMVKNIQISSAYTLKHDVAGLARSMASHGHFDALEDLLLYFRDVAKHERMILDDKSFAGMLLGAFEGYYEADRKLSNDESLGALVQEYLIPHADDLAFQKPYVESAMGLSKAGYSSLADQMVLKLFPACREYGDLKILEMESLAMATDPLLQAIASSDNSKWVRPYLAYALLGARKDWDVNQLSLVGHNKSAVRQALIDFSHDEKFNRHNAQLLISAYGELYPEDGKPFLENKSLKPLALQVDRYREQALGTDLGL